MRRAFVAIYIVGVLGAFALCLLELVVSVDYAGREPFAITYERVSVAVLCGAFAAGHLFLIKARRMVVAVAVVFYPLEVALALALSLVARGSAKGWAPASPQEALMANLVGYSVVALLLVACVGTCVWAYKKGLRNA